MEYPNKGSLFPATVRKSDKSPDFFGSVKVDRSYLRDLMEKHDEDLIEIKLSGWKRESKTGTRFVSLAIDTFVKTDAAPAPKSQEKDPWE
jgi:hypothetical protein